MDTNQKERQNLRLDNCSNLLHLPLLEFSEYPTGEAFRVCFDNIAKRVAFDQNIVFIYSVYNNSQTINLFGKNTSKKTVFIYSVSISVDDLLTIC
jgi:hypothetical protein